MAVTQKPLVSPEVLDAFCTRWKIAKLEEFDAGFAAIPADLHLLDTALPGRDWSLFDRAAAENELSELLGRSVDLVSRSAIESGGIRHRQILESARPFHAASI